MSTENNPELESFRQQWRAEVTAKHHIGESSRHQPSSTASTSAKRRPSHIAKPRPHNLHRPIDGHESSEDENEQHNKLEKIRSHGSNTSATGDRYDIDHFAKTITKEPETALEHYEKAVEREASGSLGESLDHYRKAFRLDDRVDIKYKNKHFPPSHFAKAKAKLATAAPATSAETEAPESDVPKTTKELIASFATCPISVAEPPIEGAPPPPCPIASIPEEVLVNILTQLALLDVPSYVRLAQVCRRFAYLVAKEDHVWKRLCLGPEVGYAGMHYAWQTEVLGEPILPEDDQPSIIPPTASDELAASVAQLSLDVADSLPSGPVVLPAPTFGLTPAYPTYAKMFRRRPRIRFNGIYISTVNYIRPGQAAPSQLTWGAPVHIVTYYRYLRFFRDGRVLSLLTTNEPSEVVREIQPALLSTRASATSPAHNTLKGRWKLGGQLDKEGEDAAEYDESLLTVETEGYGPKYVYRMELQLKGQEKGRARLIWRGFWNYNKLTDDWAEFGLKNDKAFVFSRVKSYGAGV